MICHSLAANSAAVHVEDVKDLRGPRIFKMRFRKSPRWLCKSRSGRWFPLFFAKDGGLMEMACFSHTHCNICMCVCVYTQKNMLFSSTEKGLFEIECVLSQAMAAAVSFFWAKSWRHMHIFDISLARRAQDLPGNTTWEKNVIPH